MVTFATTISLISKLFDVVLPVNILNPLFVVSTYEFGNPENDPQPPGAEMFSTRSFLPNPTVPGYSA